MFHGLMIWFSISKLHDVIPSITDGNYLMFDLRQLHFPYSDKSTGCAGKSGSDLSPHGSVDEAHLARSTVGCHAAMCLYCGLGLVASAPKPIPRSPVIGRCRWLTADPRLQLSHESVIGLAQLYASACFAALVLHFIMQRCSCSSASFHRCLTFSVTRGSLACNHGFQALHTSSLMALIIPGLDFAGNELFLPELVFTVYISVLPGFVLMCIHGYADGHRPCLWSKGFPSFVGYPTPVRV